MGLIKMALAAGRSTLADEVLEYFYCDALPDDVLIRKGAARNGNNKSASKYGSNNNNSNNIISNGSHIAVNEGQAMILVQDGKVTDFTMEPGVFIVDTSTEPSLFYGGFGKGIVDSFKQFGHRFTFGGDTGKDQRVYFINIRPLANQKWGTSTPINYIAPILGAQKQNLGSAPVNIGCRGAYQMIVSDPILLYKAAGNVDYEYKFDNNNNWVSQIKGQIMESVGISIQSFSTQDVEIEKLQVVGNAQLKEMLNQAITEDIVNTIGVSIEKFVIESVTPMPDSLYDEYKKTRTEVQQTSRYMDNAYAQGGKAMGQVEMMKGMAEGASKGSNGSTGVDGAMNMMGMAMMGNMMNGNGMFGGGNNQQQGGGFNGGNPTPPNGGGSPAPQGGWDCQCGQKGITGAFCSNCGAKKPEPKDNSWKCGCGADNTGAFCTTCGNKKPDENGAQQAADTSAMAWTCSTCGTKNDQGLFCHNCGSKKPNPIKKYKCDKCGWEPSDSTKPPKFCPQCGDIFNEEDIVE